MRPADVVKAWVEAFNRADVAALAALYHEDAVNHQVANEPVEGRDAIKKMFARDFTSAEMTCLVENIFQDGEWAFLEMARSTWPSRLRLLSRSTRQDRVSTRLLGQVVFPPAARFAGHVTSPFAAR